MHTYFATRGIMSARDTWVDFMKTTKLPWRRKNLATGEWEVIEVQLAVRPIELWEVVHPKECLQEVLAMQRDRTGKINVINEVNNLRPEMQKFALLYQKILGLKPFPKFDKVEVLGYRDKDGNSLPVNWVPIDGFAVYPLGIKEDVEQDFPNFTEPHAPKGFYQEGL